jgi:hypothetical protein
MAKLITAFDKLGYQAARIGGGRSPISKIADRVSGVFVPAVLRIAVVTFLVWTLGGADLQMGLVCAVAVLVIACPCALGLATPTATGKSGKGGLVSEFVTAYVFVGAYGFLKFRNFFEKEGSRYLKENTVNILTFTRVKKF